MKEFYRKVRKIWDSQTNAGTKVKAMNAWALPVVRPLTWYKSEIRVMDRKVRQLIAMRGGHQIGAERA